MASSNPDPYQGRCFWWYQGFKPSSKVSFKRASNGAQKGCSVRLFWSDVPGARTAFPAWQRDHSQHLGCLAKSVHYSSQPEIKFPIAAICPASTQEPAVPAPGYSTEQFLKVCLAILLLLLSFILHPGRWWGPLKTTAPREQQRRLAQQWAESTQLPERHWEIPHTVGIGTRPCTGPGWAQQHFESIFTFKKKSFH